MMQCLCVSHDVAVLYSSALIFVFVFLCSFIFFFHFIFHQPFPETIPRRSLHVLALSFDVDYFDIPHLFVCFTCLYHTVCFSFLFVFIDFLSFFSRHHLIAIRSMIHYHVSHIYNDTLLLLNLMLRSCFLIISYRTT